MNYKQSAQYRSYKSFIPDFLQGRPWSVIIHSLERRSKSLKYTQEDVSTDDEEGTFTVKGSNDKAHTVSFGTKSDNPTPSCTCRDWVEWHIPCKHFWAVFRFYPTWNWERLPDSYKASAYLSSDAGALNDFFNDSPSNSDSQLQDNSSTDDNLRLAQNEIPKQQVCNYKYTHMYYNCVTRRTIISYYTNYSINVLLTSQTLWKSLKQEGERARTTLKVLETSTYSCTSPQDLYEPAAKVE